MDTVYRPIDNAEPAAPETTELPIESWDKFKGEFEKAAEISHDDLSIEAATEERVRRRQEVATPENASQRPIVVHKSQGDGPKTLRQAADDLAYSRGLAMREELLASGHTELKLAELGAEKLEQQGAVIHSIRRRSRSKSLTSPARKTTRSRWSRRPRD